MKLMMITLFASSHEAGGDVALEQNGREQKNDGCEHQLREGLVVPGRMVHDLEEGHGVVDDDDGHDQRADAAVDGELNDLVLLRRGEVGSEGEVHLQVGRYCEGLVGERAHKEARQLPRRHAAPRLHGDPLHRVAESRPHHEQYQLVRELEAVSDCPLAQGAAHVAVEGVLAAVPMLDALLHIFAVHLVPALRLLDVEAL
mmetsp:Transcript_49039/g.137267  ORF Transcript_49039/g.137267 Transcript_49039/m.137267 type:complete len:200 (+) Transcript_49039:81-680(+)